MIVCSCNVVSRNQIKAVVEELVRSDPNVVLTPGTVYDAIGCRPKCGNCLTQVVEIVHSHCARLRNGRETVEP
ncbi:MAG: (2Fe-2S)-binding protein [Hyphomicrobiales bacterium]|nr:(2Fe-2S)-binding protein [Hyphomicrobiales bacterium]